MALEPDHLPRLFTDDRRVTEAIGAVQRSEQDLLEHLLIAAGLCLGRGFYASAAACLVARARILSDEA